MKIKFLTKILAAIVAASTVAITPGFSSAILPESKAYIQSIEGRRLNLNEIKEVINRLKEISQEDDEAKKEVAGVVGNMAYKGLLRGYTHEEYLSITDLLKSCANSEKARTKVGYAIFVMAKKNLLKEYTHTELLNITNVLESCSKSEEARPNVTEAIGEMVEKDLLRGYTHEELLTLTNVLTSCASNEDAQNHVAWALY